VVRTEVEVEGILSAKTGGCPEDCHFCSQSARFSSPVAATPFLERGDVIRAAEQTAELGASEFCIVLAVRGPDARLLDHICSLVPLIRERTGLNVACRPAYSPTSRRASSRRPECTATTTTSRPHAPSSARS
jgi:biotin synthase